MKFKMGNIFWALVAAVFLSAAVPVLAQPAGMPDYTPAVKIAQEDFNNCLIKRVQRNVNEQAARCAKVRGVFYNELLSWLRGLEKAGYIKPIPGAAAVYPKNGAQIDLAVGVIDSANLLNSERLFWESISEKVKGMRTGSPLDIELAEVSGNPMFSTVSALDTGDASLKLMARMARMGLVFAAIEVNPQKYDAGKMKFDKLDFAVMTDNYIGAKGDKRLGLVKKYSGQLNAMEAKAAAVLAGKPVKDDMPELNLSFTGF